MRLNELQTLSWAAIEPERSLAIVLTKGGGTRPVWLSTKALTIICEIESVRSDGGHQNLVFDLTNRRRHWERAKKAIGRVDVNWHDLRGMTATWARQFANQSDLSLIGKALGHSGTNVTERYGRVVDQEVINMLDQLPDVSLDAKVNTNSAINSAISRDLQNIQRL